MPLDEEVRFPSAGVIESFLRALRHGIVRGDVDPEAPGLERAWRILGAQAWTRSILDRLEASGFDLERSVPVLARRCAGFPAPDRRDEPLGFAVFCWANQALFDRKPYWGKWVHRVEFEAADEVREMIGRARTALGRRLS